MPDDAYVEAEPQQIYLPYYNIIKTDTANNSAYSPNMNKPFESFSLNLSYCFLGLMVTCSAVIRLNKNSLFDICKITYNTAFSNQGQICPETHKTNNKFQNSFRDIEANLTFPSTSLGGVIASG
uniref:Uncharacterized protein n=1 Tax=Glossina pallidipes TaxID=7398 RepID=A0A1A9ZLM7_GLOPL